jgi:MtrB/PioB family decaheme-associated outer membrane protein
MSKNTMKQFKLLPVAAAIVLVYSNAYAEGLTEVQALTTPESSVSVGAGSLNSGADAKRFSQYTGLNKNASVLLDVEMNKRDDATGVWTILNGRNLGLDTRELNFSQSKQGDWKYKIDYNEIVRNDPYIINTGMTGVGTTTPTINLIATPTMPAAWATANGLATSNGVAGSDVELQLKRTALGFSGDKWVTPELQVEVSFRTEDKKGARMFGRVGISSSDMQLNPANRSVNAAAIAATATATATAATFANGGINNANGGWAMLLTPEPVNSTTKQFESKVNFTRDKLALTGGYYASFYNNSNGSLSPNVLGTLNRGDLWTGCALTSATAGLGCSTIQQIASSGVALPPDNQAHQVYASGTYAYSDTTRTNFKVAFTRATQDESFTGMGLTPAATAPASLGGLVETKLVQLGLTMRPMSQLTVNGSLRYEDRADKTPIAVYNTNGISRNALNNSNNWGSGSQTRTTAKLDGIYRFASGYSVTVGGDWERKATPLPPSNTALFAAQVLFRPALTETGIHGEVRKALSETLNGALGVELKQRRGGDNEWYTTNGVSTADPATSNILVAFDPANNAAATCVQVATVPKGGWTCTAASANRVLPDMYMDRDRAKLRGNLDWEVTEQLSLQTVVEHTQDNYLRAFATPMVGVATAAQGSAAALAAMQPSQDIATVPGAKTIVTDSLSLDSSYIVSENWRINAFGTYSFNRWNVNKASLGDDTKTTAKTVGLAFNGKPTSRLSVGAELMATRDTTTFNNVVVNSTVTGAALIGTGNIAGIGTTPGNYLPEINYTTNKLNLHAEYAIDKAAAVQTAVTYQYFTTDDWQWGYNGVPFLYSDNTTVSQPMSQKLIFVAARYVYKF